MRRAIVISVIDGIVFKDIPKQHTIFKVCEQDSGTVMTDRAEWHFLELGKLEEPVDPDLMSEEECELPESSATKQKSDAG